MAGSQGSLALAGATSGVFGATAADRRTLYVTTSGALAGPVNGSVTEPAKIVAVDMSSLWEDESGDGHR